MTLGLVLGCVILNLVSISLTSLSPPEIPAGQGETSPELANSRVINGLGYLDYAQDSSACMLKLSSLLSLLLCSTTTFKILLFLLFLVVHHMCALF